MIIEKLKIEEVRENPNNPRFIKDEKWKKLVRSIKDFPQMLEIRPIVVDAEGIVLGGNMRLKACKEAGIKEIPIIRAEGLTEEQKKEFILKDNQSFGEWDTNLLSSWEKELLLDSGFEKWDLIDIFGENEMTRGMQKELEGSNFNKDVVNVDDYIKQNIFFFNEMMIEFQDDEVKEVIRNIKSDETTKESLTRDIKNVIMKYGKNSI